MARFFSNHPFTLRQIATADDNDDDDDDNDNDNDSFFFFLPFFFRKPHAEVSRSADADISKHILEKCRTCCLALEDWQLSWNLYVPLAL